MRFSIIIPTFNAVTSLHRCIESVACQLCGESEIIIIDDGSTDSTKACCNKWMQVCPNVKYYWKTNGGPGEAREYGVMHSTGEYLVFIDSDDYVEPHMFREIDNFLTSHDEVDIIEFGCRKVDMCRNIIAQFKPEPEELNETKCLHHYVIQKNTTNYLWNKIFRRSLFQNITFPKLYASEDRCVLTQLYGNAKKTVSMSDIFYNYVMTPNSLCRSSMSLKKLDIVDADIFIAEYLERREQSLVKHFIEEATHNVHQ